MKYNKFHYYVSRETSQKNLKSKNISKKLDKNQKIRYVSRETQQKRMNLVKKTKLKQKEIKKTEIQ